MKVNREGGYEDIISFYFRIVNIKEEMRDFLLSELSSFKVEVGQNRKDGSFFVISIDLNEPSIDVLLIKKILTKYQISDNSYGLWVSVRSAFDHGGFTLPENIANLYHELRGSLDVSYTIA